MKPFALSPEAEEDVWGIWQYLAQEASPSVADRIESDIAKKIEFLAGMPGAGHWRRDLTDEPVKFFPVYSYLICLQAREETIAGRGRPSQPPRLRPTLAGTPMTAEIIPSHSAKLAPAGLFAPTPAAKRRVIEFFTTQIDNDTGPPAVTRRAQLARTAAPPVDPPPPAA